VVRAQQTPVEPPPPVEPARTPFGRTEAGIAEAQLAKREAQPRPEELPSSEAKVRAAAALQQDLFERARKLTPGGATAAEDFRQR
jgi:hypothetical protein